MKFKKHKKEEISFCQSGKHRMPKEFCDGEICFLIEYQTMEKYMTRIVVCAECRKGIGEVPLKKIVVEA
jgi:hypothetical protein